MNYRKKYISPRVRHLKPKKKFFQKPVFWIVLAAVLAGALAYVLLFYSTFQVSHIEISGNEKIHSQDITARVNKDIQKTFLAAGAFSIASRSIFIASSGAITKDLLAAFPEMENARVQKKLPQDILITIEERQPFAVFCNGQNPEHCFFIDDQGVVFQSLSSDTQSDLPVMRLTSAGQVAMGQTVASGTEIEAVKSIQKNIKNNFQIDAKEIWLGTPMIIKTSEQWKLYIDPTQDIDLQITKLNALLGSMPEANRKNLQYIYLQYRDRAFYK